MQRGNTKYLRDTNIVSKNVKFGIKLNFSGYVHAHFLQKKEHEDI